MRSEGKAKEEAEQLGRTQTQRGPQNDATTGAASSARAKANAKTIRRPTTGKKQTGERSHHIARPKGSRGHRTRCGCDRRWKASRTPPQIPRTRSQPRPRRGEKEQRRGGKPSEERTRSNRPRQSAEKTRARRGARSAEQGGATGPHRTSRPGDAPCGKKEPRSAGTRG